jgi:hypothetical protein
MPRSEPICSQPWVADQTPQFQRAGKPEASNNIVSISNIDATFQPPVTGTGTQGKRKKPTWRNTL